MKAANAMLLLDVSHTIEEKMITYKGLPAPVITDYIGFEQSHKNYSPGTEFHIGKIELVANTGTYLDTPYHRFRDREDLSAMPLKSIEHLCNLGSLPGNGFKFHAVPVKIKGLGFFPVRAYAVLDS